MGENFWGPEEWFAKYGVKFTKEQIDQIENFPWDRKYSKLQMSILWRISEGLSFCFFGELIK